MPQVTRHPLLLRTSALLGFALMVGTTNASAADTATDDSSTTSASQPTNELISKFTSFAGSTTNAQSLVNGLRNGSAVTLHSTTPTIPGATFSPPTKPMGFGNINIALSLARSELASQGITQPTPSQIETALLGGPLTTASGSTNLPGILTLRNGGEGWARSPTLWALSSEMLSGATGRREWRRTAISRNFTSQSARKKWNA